MSGNVPSTTLDEVKVTAPAVQVSPMASPYAVRQINLTFKLGTGNFGTSGSNVITVTGLRVIAHVEQSLNPTMQSSLAMKVYGLSLDPHMNALSVAGLLYAVRSNQVLVEAGDSTSGMTTIFNGSIVQAFPDLDTAEDAHFFVQGSPGALPALKPVAPTSYPGSVPAATAMQAMAQQAGLNFQNNGVTAVLQSPYFPGTAWQQLQSAVQAAGCYAYLDDLTNTFKIWPKTGPTPEPNATVVVSPRTGMIGYPKFQRSRIIVRTLFSPQIVASPGSIVLVQSQLKAANNAKLVISKITHDVSSQFPNGPWETTIEGNPLQLSGASA